MTPFTSDNRITRVTGRQPYSGTINLMPDDYHYPMPRPDPERIDLGAIKADLEFLIERTERFRKEQVLKPLYVMVGSAAIVIGWIELFCQHCVRHADRLPVSHEVNPRLAGNPYHQHS
jgi:hypothetical protein